MGEVGITRRRFVNIIGIALLSCGFATTIRQMYKSTRTPGLPGSQGGMPTPGHLRFLTGDNATARFVAHVYISENKIFLAGETVPTEIAWNRENGFVFMQIQSPRKLRDSRAKAAAIEWLDNGLKALSSSPASNDARVLSAVRDFLIAQPEQTLFMAIGPTAKTRGQREIKEV